MLAAAFATIGAVVIALGLALMAGGALGMLRFPDIYTRLHAARLADGAGAVLVLLGLAAASGDGAIALRLLLLAALVVALGPTLSRLIANAAHAGGIAPVVGAYKAPRPDARDGRRTS